MKATSEDSPTGRRWSMMGVALLCLGIAALLLGLAAVAYADPPTTTPRDVSGWHRSAFSVWLDVVAGTTAGDELYATRVWMDWEPSYHQWLWDAGVVSGWGWESYSFVSGHDGLRTVSFYSVGHNDVSNAYEQESTKSVSVKIDTTAPLVAVSPKPTGWVNTGQSLSFTVTDPNMPYASGLKSFNLKVDGATSTWAFAEGTSAAAKTWEVPAPVDHSNDGLHSFEYWAGDWAGNESYHDAYSNSFSFGIDTVAPSGSFALAGGAAKTAVTTVSGNSSVSDAHGPLQLRFSLNDKVTWSPWASYATSTSLTLPSGLGTKTVYAQYRDAAGNVLELSDAIELVPSAGPTPTPTITPTLTLGLSGLEQGVLKLGKRVTARGTVTPTSLVGGKVTLTVQKKRGAKWVKAKTASMTIRATSAYSWTYKATNRGAYRVRAAIAKTAANTAARTAWCSFRVK